MNFIVRNITNDPGKFVEEELEQKKQLKVRVRSRATVYQRLRQQKGNILKYLTSTAIQLSLNRWKS